MLNKIMKICNIVIIILVMTLCLGCIDNRQTPVPQNETKIPESKCGDGICNPIERERGICPGDCPSLDTNKETKNENTNSFRYNPDTYSYKEVTIENTLFAPVSYRKYGEKTTNVEGKPVLIMDYYVKNPSSAAEMDVSVFVPALSSKTLPAVILVPGGLGAKSSFIQKYSPASNYSIAEKYASEGFVVIIFSADGRERSGGEENYNGYIHQDGLYEIYRFARELGQVEKNNIGIVSYSYGVTMATGMLGRYQPSIKYYIEWEGPVNRFYTTVGCKGTGQTKPDSPGAFSCDDEDHWIEREALRFVPYMKLNYFLIIQSEKDHVQPNVNHSVEINNLAIKNIKWVRVNGPENQINKIYSEKNLPVISEKTKLEETVLQYIKELSSK
ncbi:MAG: Alpha/beta hydrolase family protein [Candidatus Methanofastidiosum methylothiophilum]|uniref:Alpha/beta hydrolase family protein n=1 Tax=Candidatus Methanofastidiosum methylothiophilum TaxID=1705564 RepID=A0A150J8I7_9EURY|nr:MAG: Alpha/beta hydrolase family protein [Candidatus Methanofastidiosum methylthiophilus]